MLISLMCYLIRHVKSILWINSYSIVTGFPLGGSFLQKPPDADEHEKTCLTIIAAIIPISEKFCLLYSYKLV